MPRLSDTRHDNPALEAALTKIYGLHRKEFDFRLDKGPYRDLLIKLGNPHLKLPPTIHVAGTNGKGSTIAQMRAQLEAMGKTVHVYTSPHLFKFNERLRVASYLIGDDALLKEISHIFAVNDNAPITFFEFTSALMFHVFAKNPADYALIEVGMGGRLDCTNVIENPIATIITSIGYDHQAFLGDSIAQIASEKAGIIKEKSPCILAHQPYPEAAPAIQNIAEQKNASLIHAPIDHALTPHLDGAHQMANASAAKTALEIIIPNFQWNNKAKPQWAGRFQKLNADFDLYYDGAHNIDSLKALSDNIQSKFPQRSISFIFAIQAKKDVSMIKETLSHFNAPFYVTKLVTGDSERSAIETKTAFENAGIPVKSAHEDMKDAIATAHRDHPENIVIVSGSLYAAQLIPAPFWIKL